MIGRSCGQCQFWEQDPKMGELGWCRRNAPIPVTHGVSADDHELPQHDAVWPMTFGEEWCGEYSWSGGE